MGVAQGYERSDAVQQAEQLGMVFNDPLDADIASQLIAAVLACGLFVVGWVLGVATHAMGVQPAQTCFVCGDFVGERGHDFGFAFPSSTDGHRSSKRWRLWLDQGGGPDLGDERAGADPGSPAAGQ